MTFWGPRLDHRKEGDQCAPCHFVQLYLLWYFHGSFFPRASKKKKLLFFFCGCVVSVCPTCIERLTIPRSPLLSLSYTQTHFFDAKAKRQRLLIQRLLACTNIHERTPFHLPRLAQSRSARRRCQWTSNMIDGTSTDHLPQHDALNRIIRTNPTNNSNDDHDESR